MTQETQGRKKVSRQRALASHKALVIKVDLYAKLGYLLEQSCRDDFAEPARFADDLIKKISVHIFTKYMGLSSKERKPYLKQARVSSWHPYTDQPRPSGGEKEAKKIKMATTLGADKKGSDLTKQEKMTNAPVRTAASEPGDTSQHTTETKKVELNKLCSNTVYIFN